MTTIASQITGGKVKPAFREVLLGKYDVTYFECLETGFIQTETPYWLPEAYNSAITALDIGLISRNYEKSRLAVQIIDKCFPTHGRFLDYGGGYGMFTRLMRDKGFDFTHYDIHCDNLFAKGFEITNSEPWRENSYLMTTAWEVMEHVESPVDTVSQIFDVSSAFLFSTELIPDRKLRGACDWWYISPDIGQHISFYTLKSLEYLAGKFNSHLYSDGYCNHLITKHALKENPFKTRRDSVFTRVGRKLKATVLTKNKNDSDRKSLLMQDYDYALAQLRLGQKASNENERFNG